MTEVSETARRPFLVTIVALMLAQLIGALNWNIVSTALPRVVSDLDGTPAQATWMVTATLLGITVSAPIWGRLGDLFPPFRLLRIGITAYIAAAVMAAAANSMIVLIIARALQGLAIGAMVALVFIVLARIVPPRDRGLYLGWLSAVQLIGTVTGPFIGGLLVESPLGWRASFFIVAPVAVVVLILLHFSLRIEPDPSREVHIDYLGATLLAVSVSSILVWVSFVGDAFAIDSPLSWLLLGGGAFLFLVAMVVEWRAPEPVIPLRFFMKRVPLLVALASAALGLAATPIVLLMSFYFQNGRGIGPVITGLLIISVAVGSVASSFLVGVHSGRTGLLKPYLLIGALLLASGNAMLWIMGADAPLAAVVAILFVFGLGQGATQQFIVLAGQNAVGLRDVGAVTGSLNFVQQLGGTTALSILGLLIGNRIDELTGDGISWEQAYAVAIPEQFLLLTIFAAVAIAAIAALPTIRLRKTMDLEEEPAGA